MVWHSGALSSELKVKRCGLEDWGMALGEDSCHLASGHLQPRRIFSAGREFFDLEERRISFGSCASTR